MGQQEINKELSAQQLRLFEKHLLSDIRAIEQMESKGLFECDVRRIGAEQEMFLIDSAGRPAPVAMELLERLDDDHFTTELARYNIELNLPPLSFEKKCLTTLESNLRSYIDQARKAAQELGCDIVLIGILPTLNKNDFTLDSMTPRPRYYALNDAIMKIRGAEYEIYLRGTDELYIKHDSVMFEAANTSFQVHFQTSPENFALYYNIAQAVAAPSLSIAANSPVFLGKRLWRESRIPLFQQSVDTRRHPLHLRKSLARVSFGTRWVQQSVTEIFKEDITRFRVMMGARIDENSLDVLQEGGIPKLKALQLHNGTVYRWNRPCYGITDGKPHLRIENRIFPSGPSIVDEVANAAFWFGLISGMAREYGDITRKMNFDDAKTNFIAAARRGLRAQFTWFGGKTIPAPDLIINELIPLAEQGLRQSDIDARDIQRYLGIVRDRVKTGQTGAEWMLNSWAKIRCSRTLHECLATITLAARDRQRGKKPVHEWPLAKPSKKSDWRTHFRRVEQFMSTDIFTVGEDDSIELVLNMMEWRTIRHVPVENHSNELVGVVDYLSLLSLIKNHRQEKDILLQPVKMIMRRNVPTVTPDTSTQEALNIILKHSASCLPVLHDGILVGIITEHDFMRIAGHLVDEE